jgi:hypothetical protein
MKQFIIAIKGLDKRSIIAAADQEAFEAWRYAKCHHHYNQIHRNTISSYEQGLKNLVTLLRCNLFPQSIYPERLFLKDKPESQLQELQNVFKNFGKHQKQKLNQSRRSLAT